MIDKASGKIAYAVLVFGGFLGFGQKRFPVPWNALKYDLKAEAYELDINEEQLRQAPSYQPGEEFDSGRPLQSKPHARALPSSRRVRSEGLPADLRDMHAVLRGKYGRLATQAPPIWASE